MKYTAAISEVIKSRNSCRNYLKKPLSAEVAADLSGFMEALPAGPLGNKARFSLLAAMDMDGSALKGLGTYGFIKNTRAFIVGAVSPGDKYLEDFGYLMEALVLRVTDLGLGSCWLGGSFTRSRFAQKISLRDDEEMPVVISVGYRSDQSRWLDRTLRRQANSDSRLLWEQLFFEGEFGHPLSEDAAGAYAQPLSLLRLAPSASNKQPWRIVKDGKRWHFYLSRSKGYSGGAFKVMQLSDLQRVDIGIAMCHFGLAAREVGLSGKWLVGAPDITTPNSEGEYVVTWQAE